MTFQKGADWGGNYQVYVEIVGANEMNLNREVGCDPPLSNGVTTSNVTLMGTSHLDPRLANFWKIPRCRIGVFPHLSLTED